MTKLYSVIREDIGFRIKKKCDYEAIYSTFCWNVKNEGIINKNNINDPFKSIHGTVILNMQESLVKRLGWINDSINNCRSHYWCFKEQPIMR